MDDYIILANDEGQEFRMRIVLTFEDEKTGKKYVLITDPNEDGEEDQTVFAYSYDEDGNLEEITDPEEFEMCEEVLFAFTEDNDGNEEN
jgi:YD repeat-containing protein